MSAERLLDRLESVSETDPGLMKSANLSHHLIGALDSINDAHTKVEEIRHTPTETVDAIRSDIKAGIMDAYHKEQISALYVECLFRLFKLEAA